MRGAIDRERPTKLCPTIARDTVRPEKIDMADRRAIERWTNEGGALR